MPRNDKYNNDDYVAKLLAEDAKKSSQRYAAVGLSALLPKRPVKAAPKPNTRFLNNLVREADSHNAALKKKEELEARIRLRDLRENETSNRRDRDDERERKKRRLKEDEDRKRRRRHDERSRERRRSVSPRDGRREKDQDRDRRKTSHRRDHEREGHKHSRRHRVYSPERDSEPDRRSGSSPKTTSKNANTYRQCDRLKPSKRSHSHSHSRSRSRSHSVSSSTSDPLDSIVGPRPSKPAVRGRGAYSHASKSTSNIDSHFSSTYNPALDVHTALESDSERGDWDMALEALRDRSMWKKKQADRMREAGFGDDEIKKWERTAGSQLGSGEGNDGDVRDVRWKKKGEAREWDLGKEEMT